MKNYIFNFGETIQFEFTVTTGQVNGIYYYVNTITFNEYKYLLIHLHYT